MVIFVISVITAAVGMYTGLILGKSELSACLGAIICLSFPYAFILEKIF